MYVIPTHAVSGLYSPYPLGLLGNCKPVKFIAFKAWHNIQYGYNNFIYILYICIYIYIYIHKLYLCTLYMCV